jgi:hypothetical protein
MTGILIHNGTSYQARVSRVSDATNFRPPWSAQTTHTASIQTTGAIKKNDTVTFEGVTYRVLSVSQVLNKTRLELTNKL